MSKKNYILNFLKKLLSVIYFDLFLVIKIVLILFVRSKSLKPNKLPSNLIFYIFYCSSLGKYFKTITKNDCKFLVVLIYLFKEKSREKIIKTNLLAICMCVI